MILSFLKKLFTNLSKPRPVPVYVPPNYEPSATNMDDLELARYIRDLCLALGHSRRMYKEHITSDKDDDVLRRCFMSHLEHYPTRGERLRAIWETGVLDDGQNRIYRKRKKKSEPSAGYCVLLMSPRATSEKKFGKGG